MHHVIFQAPNLSRLRWTSCRIRAKARFQSTLGINRNGGDANRGRKDEPVKYGMNMKHRL
jgi:hypothetical protein